MTSKQQELHAVLWGSGPRIIKAPWGWLAFVRHKGRVIKIASTMSRDEARRQISDNHRLYRQKFGR